jgi:hypothetical protein
VELLKQIALRIAAAETPKEVIEVVLATFAEVLHYNTAVVFFFDASLTNLNIFRTSGMNAGVERYVHGRDSQARPEFLALMEAGGMQPVVWDDTSVEENVFFRYGHLSESLLAARRRSQTPHRRHRPRLGEGAQLR